MSRFFFFFWGGVYAHAYVLMGGEGGREYSTLAYKGGRGGLKCQYICVRTK